MAFYRLNSVSGFSRPLQIAFVRVPACATGTEPRSFIICISMTARRLNLSGEWNFANDASFDRSMSFTRRSYIISVNDGRCPAPAVQLKSLYGSLVLKKYVQIPAAIECQRPTCDTRLRFINSSLDLAIWQRSPPMQPVNRCLNINEDLSGETNPKATFPVA
jgi:hypothetical protein